MSAPARRRLTPIESIAKQIALEAPPRLHGETTKVRSALIGELRVALAVRGVELGPDLAALHAEPQP